MPIPTLILSIVAIIAGTVLLLFGPDKADAMSTVLILAGAGGLTRTGYVAHKEKKAAEVREQAAMETTQTLRIKLAERESRKETGKGGDG